MLLKQEALAGTLESSDLFIRITPSDDPLEIVIESEVLHQFGKQIRATVEEVLDHLGVTTGTLIIQDKGALDCTIRARVQAAVMRAAGETTLDWEALK
ncbi:citrate lyase acyl carrier protein [Aliiruegeria lutimaris]|uniref:Citrate lyase acyl carrier protein n=1 Tax=Aliiruegeria lutimaris TaxID=571298 RepID=A0A1G9ALN8_9RHOB|nr:citrate lyase acyl carrier protein [Aliiruegeria lutimaris]SDK28151.1 citrate lyase subunit gamma (acyl carrier protein) [Aliiruegeria lutimaris]